MFSFDAHLVPLADDPWPVFDEIVVATLSPSSSVTSPSPSVLTDALPPAFPSVIDLAAMPIPPSRASPRNKNPNHIPRPRNAFMLFRSAFAAAQKITTTIEHDNRHITRIIAHCWNRLSDSEKQIWRDKAAAEKAQHAERYPNYRFRPVGRAKKPKKRKVRRNGVADVKRCETVAHLVMAGKSGVELERAMDKIESVPRLADALVVTDADVFADDHQRGTLLALPQESHPYDVPPFRSPLLPPAETVPDESMIPRPSVIATPETFCSPVGTAESLFHSPCYQYYQPDLHNDMSCSSVMSPAHYQPIMAFAHAGHPEPEQSVPSYSLLAWNQSDSFSYYQ